MATNLKKDFLWQKGRNEEFFNTENSIHESLKFTYHMSGTSMLVFDTEVYKGNWLIKNGILVIK